jgi:hypothetical protein
MHKTLVKKCWQLDDDFLRMNPTSIPLTIRWQAYTSNPCLLQMMGNLGTPYFGMPGFPDVAPAIMISSIIKQLFPSPALLMSSSE